VRQNNYMKSFNVTVPSDQIMPYTRERVKGLKDFERRHAVKDAPSVIRYRQALSILDKVQNRYQSEYARMNEWRDGVYAFLS
jgi:hypothetical protein